jgi:PAS domain S-box-containing protein
MPNDLQVSPQPALDRGRDEVALLYVEDESEARNMVSRMLELNYPQMRVIAAENGAAGLARFREHRPQIVVTDINMPVMDGIQMSRSIRQLDPEITIVAVTAHSDTSYLLHAIQIGIHHYVLKPINYDELFAALDRVLAGIELKRTVARQNRRISESQHQLAVAQRIAHLGSWQWDLDGAVMRWSDELFRIWGLEPGSEAVPSSEFFGRLHPQDRAHLEIEIARAGKMAEPLEPQICRLLRRDGTQRVLRVAVEFAGTPAGTPATLIGTCLDVTELKRAEDEIRSLTDALERRVRQRTSLLQASLKELESFSYLVSHDLRAPVARLEGFSHALLEDCGNCSNSSCGEYARRSIQVVQQIKSIIGAFNDLSHYTRCAMTVGEVDLSALVRHICEDFRTSEPQRRVEFVIAPGITVRGDHRLLHTALEHLVGNAWKFTAKKAKARIEFGFLDEERDEARVHFVKDNGAGFDMKYVGKLFKPFQTIHSPGEFSWSGAAIGLATVQSIVLRHGGRIWAEGAVGQGATFYFTLERNPEAVNNLDH